MSIEKIKVVLALRWCYTKRKAFLFSHNPKLMEKCSRLAEYARFIRIRNECKENEKDLKSHDTGRV